MRPSNVYQLELAGVFANARTTLMKLGYAYLLGFPFALISFAPRIRVIGITLLVLFTSFFGAATTIVTRRNDGHMARLKLLPLSKAGLYGDILLSASAVDILQVGVVIIVLIAVNATGFTAGLFFSVAGSFVLSVFAMNILGMLLGAISRNSQEVHVTGAIGVGVIGFLSGLYPMPDRIDRFIGAVSRYNPLRLLATNLERWLSPGAQAVPAWETAVWAALFAVVVVLLAARTLSNTNR